MAQFTNQATISYNGIVANSNVVTGEITQVITAWKDATVSEYQSGDIINYVISIQNSGTGDYTGLTITDDLGSYPFGTGTLVPLTYTGDPVLYYINGILQTAPSVDAGPPLVIRGINIPAGLSATIIYRAALNEYAPLGTGASITNTAGITGGGITETVTTTVTLTHNPEATLSIIKALNPTTIVENGQVDYTFTIQNIGPVAASAATNLILRDTFDPVLASPISVTLNGALWPETGNYTYNSTSGLFSTTASALTVPAAKFTQDVTTGIWSSTPGVTIITVSGTI